MTLYECLLAVLCNLWLVFNISVGWRLKDMTRQLQIDLSFGSLAQNLSKNAAKLTLPPSNWGFPVWTPVRIEDFYCHHTKDNKIVHINNQSLKFDPLPPSRLNFYLLSMYLWKNRLCWVYQDGDILILLMYPLGMSLCPNYLGCHLTELPKNHLRVPFPHSNLVRRSLVISSWDMFL